jgi:hypothetical protein
MVIRATRRVLVVAAAFTSLPAMPIASLISGADAVVLGTESAPVQTGRKVSFCLEVERVFSGDVQPSAFLNVVWNARTPLQLAGSSSFRGIWFLRKTTGGGWECIPLEAN